MLDQNKKVSELTTAEVLLVWYLNTKTAAEKKLNEASEAAAAELKSKMAGARSFGDRAKKEAISLMPSPKTVGFASWAILAITVAWMAIGTHVTFWDVGIGGMAALVASFGIMGAMFLLMPERRMAMAVVWADEKTVVTEYEGRRITLPARDGLVLQKGDRIIVNRNSDGWRILHPDEYYR